MNKFLGIWLCPEPNPPRITTEPIVPWFDPKVVYLGPWEVKPANPYANFTPSKSPAPKGGTFYPVMLD